MRIMTQIHLAELQIMARQKMADVPLWRIKKV